MITARLGAVCIFLSLTLRIEDFEYHGGGHLPAGAPEEDG